MALFDYGNTRLRARLSELQPLEKLESYADLTSIDSFLSLLTKTPYKESIEAALTYAHGYYCLSQAMRMEFEQIASDLGRFYQNAEGKLVSIIFMRDDLLNLKTIVRGQTHNIPLEELEDAFLSLGTIPLAFLKELAKAKNLDDAINKMAVYELPPAQALLQLRSEKVSLSASEINLALEKWYFQKIQGLLKGSSENIMLLREFYAIEVDITNLNTIMRVVASPERYENTDFKSYLIGQGNISQKTLINLSRSGSIETLVGALLKTKYSASLKKGLECYADTNLISEFENQMRMYMLNWQSKLPKLNPLGIGVPLGYFARKRSEIRNLRWIGKGIASGFESRYIKENLGEDSMNKLVVITRKDQAHGFKLAGVDAIGVDNAETVYEIISAWLNKKEQILLAIDDGLFSQLDKALVKRVYASDQMHLVTIPDGPVSEAGAGQMQSIYDMIRHATGVQIRFKGEMDGTKS